jgi:hypothetical protein
MRKTALAASGSTAKRNVNTSVPLSAARALTDRRTSGSILKLETTRCACLSSVLPVTFRFYGVRVT